MTEVLETRGDYSVTVSIEEGPDEPYADGTAPILRMDNIRSEHVIVAGRPAESDDRIEEAADRWGPPNRPTWKLFERYLKAFHGVTQIETYYSGSYWYAAYDSAEWRAYVGLEIPGADADLHLMDEYKAWIEGEVYSWTVEKRVTWHAVNPVTDDPEYAGYPDRDTWETVDSCGGYYGYEYAAESALEALGEYAPVLSEYPPTEVKS